MNLQNPNRSRPLRLAWHLGFVAVAIQAVAGALLLGRGPHPAGMHLAVPIRVGFGVTMVSLLLLSWWLTRRSSIPLSFLAFTIAAGIGLFGIVAAVLEGAPADVYPPFLVAAVALALCRPRVADPKPRLD